MKKCLLYNSTFGVLLLFLSGCFGTTTYHLDKHEPLSEKECRNIPEIWWGDRGEDPSSMPLYRCYNWTIEKR